ncbi:MAG: hypothetical protein OXE86_15400 [Alphaproteobacteria bacterium]|nr:hypothetical protein [Alphaproteobacteria bacterium]
MDTRTDLTHAVQALNLAANSENRIHDDAVARRFGFKGGLVPGVEVYAYMTNPVLRHFGVDWLRSGMVECRLMKPVYDGREAVASARPDGEGGLDLAVWSEGIACASGRASLPQAPAGTRTEIPHAPITGERPPASPESLPVGAVLGTFVEEMTPGLMEEYLEGARETLELYRDARLVHPGWILRLANRALTENVTLGPWMHVGSTVRNLDSVSWGEQLQARSRVTRNHEHRGHLFVELDVEVLRDDGTAVARIDHVSIYRPRQVSDAA